MVSSSEDVRLLAKKTQKSGMVTKDTKTSDEEKLAADNQQLLRFPFLFSFEILLPMLLIHLIGRISIPCENTRIVSRPASLLVVCFVINAGPHTFLFAHAKVNYHHDLIRRLLWLVIMG